MKPNKKGAELALSVIIIAVIALIVLVVLAVIFISKGRTFGEGVADCAGKGGECIGSGTSENPYCPEGYVYIRKTNCEKQGRLCCLKILEERTT